jgi:hypothetical protein
MGRMKELYTKRLEAITNVMDQVTKEYNAVLSFYDYIDHLQDYFEMDELKEFEAGILDHFEFLDWTRENELETITR